MKKSYYHKMILFTAFICTVFLNSCSSTHITSSWRAPDKQIYPTDWKKVLVVALLRNETNRHSAEDEMAKYLDSTQKMNRLYGVK